MQKFEIHTSCGKVFHETLDQMSDRQIAGLIDGNPDHPDIPVLREELERRRMAREARQAA
ncbi:hypothetical protein ACQKP1_07715 [Allorhizobium sp. NPDC080224]|uniref:hypothetical protein n=1 Tax=Allorhizobium sp. NPDC080224 TaxID=3390547 RepID=UPI003D03746A